jgi:hypothetical protein
MAGPRRTIDEILADGTPVDRAAREGVRAALRRHKRLGESIAVWRDGRVVEIPPDEITVGEGEGTSSPPAAAGPDAPEAA